MSRYIRKKELRSQRRAVLDTTYAHFDAIRDEDREYISQAVKRFRKFLVGWCPCSSHEMAYKPIDIEHIANTMQLYQRKRDVPDGSLWLYQGELWTVDYHVTLHTDSRHDVVVLRNIERGTTMFQRVGSMVPRMYYPIEFPT